MRRTAEDAAQTRRALITSALSVFAEQGFAGARLADIAERAGMTRGALYHHFADKDALYLALLTESWDTVAAPVWALLDSDGAPVDRLGRFLTAWLRHLREDPAFRDLLTVTVGSGAPAGSHPGGLAAKAHGLADWRARFETLVLAARLEGSVPAAVEPAHAASHLIAWLCGTALLAASDPELLPPADADGVAMILRGLRA